MKRYHQNHKEFILGVFLFIFLSLWFCLAIPNSFCEEIVNDSELLYQRIKEANTPGEKETLWKEAEKIKEKAGNEIGRVDYAGLGVKIYISHCTSIIGEIFYILEHVKPYYNYEESLYYEKLMNLKENRNKYDIDEIDEEEFEENKRNIERNYLKKLENCKDYLADKTERLEDLIDYYKANVKDTKQNLNNSYLKGPLKENILKLKDEKVWKDFMGQAQEGEQMRQAITNSGYPKSEQIICNIEKLFRAFEIKEDPYAPIFPVELIRKL